MDTLLNQRVAYITGAGSGIGLEVARSFAQEGAKVVISDVNEKASQEAANKLKEEGYEALAVTCDVTKEDQIRSTLDETVNTFGSLDILVNNAGLQYVSP